MPEKREELKILQRRIWFLGGVFLPFIAVLIGRLWWVQIKQGPAHIERISRQSVRDIRVPPVRGRILDREGEVLVDNRPTFDLVFIVEHLRRRGPVGRTVDDLLALGDSLARLIGRESPLDETRVRRHISWYPALPLIVFSDLDKLELTMISERIDAFPGVEIRPGFRRAHPHPETAVHLLGFTGARYPADEARLRRFAYFEREPHGRSGLELHYDELLSGKAGRKTVRVDTLGYVHEEAARAIAPEHGANLILELDLKAQQTAERLMREHTGAFVLLDANTGGVLAMVSSPGYSLHDLSASRYAELATDNERRPLINRATSAGYMPGSIIKPLVAIAAMEADVLFPSETMTHCPGYFQLGTLRIRCAARGGHGNLAFHAALAQSCNTFFIDLGQRTRLEQLAATFRQAGLGASPEIDLPGGGDGGLVPSRQWARERLNRGWIASDTAFISIGQGNIVLSPLQAAMFASAIANRGIVYQPRLARSAKTEDGVLLRNFPPVVKSRLTVDPAGMEAVGKAMAAVVEGPLASARQAGNQAISVAGKTGTAEVGAGEQRYKNTWFIGYAPVEEPRFAFAVVVERGDSGGRTAAPIVGRFFERWLAAAAD